MLSHDYHKLLIILSYYIMFQHKSLVFFPESAPFIVQQLFNLRAIMILTCVPSVDIRQQHVWGGRRRRRAVWRRSVLSRWNWRLKHRKKCLWNYLIYDMCKYFLNLHFIGIKLRADLVSWVSAQFAYLLIMLKVKWGLAFGNFCQYNTDSNCGLKAFFVGPWDS